VAAGVLDTFQTGLDELVLQPETGHPDFSGGGCDSAGTGSRKLDEAW